MKKIVSGLVAFLIGISSVVPAFAANLDNIDFAVRSPGIMNNISFGISNPVYNSGTYTSMSEISSFLTLPSGNFQVDSIGSPMLAYDGYVYTTTSTGTFRYAISDADGYRHFGSPVSVSSIRAQDFIAVSSS